MRLSRITPPPLLTLALVAPEAGVAGVVQLDLAAMRMELRNRASTGK